MPLVLPSIPAARSVTPRLITSRNELLPAFGGPAQRLPRMGSRYALDVALRPMTYAQAQEWGDIEDEADTCVMAIPQPGFDTGAPGSPVVDGAAQSGSTLNLKTATPNYVLSKRQWLTVITGGQRFAYRARSAVVADAAGLMAVPLQTMLRRAPADGDVVEIARPKIEGYVTVADDAWSIDASDRLIRLAFTIAERE